MSSAATLCRRQGNRLHCYLGDSFQEVAKARYWTLQLTEHLGLLVNWEKSGLTLSQHLIYQGMEIDTKSSQVFPSEQSPEVSRTRQPPSTRVAMFNRSHCILGSRGPCPFEIHSTPATDELDPSQGSKYKLVAISADVLLDLIWWVESPHLLQGVPLQQPVADLQLFTEVSTQGWGAHLLQLEVSEPWPPEESCLHKTPQNSKQ